jgi:alpha-beta hydrolase superfamily lysophospholipase
MKLPRRLLRWLLYAVVLVAIVLATIVVVYALQARRLPDLRAWHRVKLHEEFRADRADMTFDEYRKLEDRLFTELRAKVLDDPSAADTSPFGRYTPGSEPEKLALDTIYNRSYELVPANPRGGVLLVHGLTDSPYSMRGLAETFRAEGFYVLALRLPGHGTIPSSLADASWKDWYAAVRIAAKHVAERVPGKPFYAGGHSTGAALVTLYALRSLGDPALPRPERVVLVSPAIAISPFAALTRIVACLSFLPAFEKSRWVDVLPESDPYKYNSFPVNAANQIYSLTRALHGALLDEAKRGSLERMPPLLVFQSVVDSTVTAREVVTGLLGLLPARGDELVVFDVNRRDTLEGIVAPGPLEQLDVLRRQPKLPFRLTIVGSRPDGSSAIATFTREAGETGFREEDLPLEWPRGVFSLGHVALPFPADDPVYGIDAEQGPGHGFQLGNVSARGESGALLVPLGTFARLRSNPFFEVIRMKVVDSLPSEPGKP